MPYVVLDPLQAVAAPAVSFGAPEAAPIHPFGKSLKMMRDRLILELGNRTDIGPTFWNEWINDSYQDLWVSLKFADAKRSYGFSLTPDKYFYLIPQTVSSIRDISGNDPTQTYVGGPLNKIDEFSFRKLPYQRGQVDSWFVDQRMIVVWPLPDKAYPVSVDCTARPAPLVDDNNYPAMDDMYHEVILTGARARAWEAVQNDTRAMLSENKVVRQVQRKDDKDVKNRESEYPSLRPVFTRRDLMNLRKKTGIEPGE